MTAISAAILLALAAAWIAAEIKARRKPAPEAAPPAGWRTDPGNPAAAVRDGFPRSGQGTTQVTIFTGYPSVSSGGGCGGAGGSTSVSPGWPWPHGNGGIGGSWPGANSCSPPAN